MLIVAAVLGTFSVCALLVLAFTLGVRHERARLYGVLGTALSGLQERAEALLLVQADGAKPERARVH